MPRTFVATLVVGLLATPFALALPADVRPPGDLPVPPLVGDRPPIPVPPPGVGPIPLIYNFGVVIKQDTTNAVPYVSGALMAGCVFTATTNVGKVTCSPPTAPPAGYYWYCSFSGLIAQATSGTVVGRTACANEPTVTAVATYPTLTWNLQRDPLYLTHPIYQFPWYCKADFSKQGTGSVLCDEPDPPVQYW